MRRRGGARAPGLACSRARARRDHPSRAGRPRDGRDRDRHHLLAVGKAIGRPHQPRCDADVPASRPHREGRCALLRLRAARRRGGGCRAVAPRTGPGRRTPFRRLGRHRPVARRGRPGRRCRRGAHLLRHHADDSLRRRQRAGGALHGGLRGGARGDVHRAGGADLRHEHEPGAHGGVRGVLRRMDRVLGVPDGAADRDAPRRRGVPGDARSLARRMRKAPSRKQCPLHLLRLFPADGGANDPPIQENFNERSQRLARTRPRHGQEARLHCPTHRSPHGGRALRVDRLGQGAQPRQGHRVLHRAAHPGSRASTPRSRASRSWYAACSSSSGWRAVSRLYRSW